MVAQVGFGGGQKRRIVAKLQDCYGHLVVMLRLLRLTVLAWKEKATDTLAPSNRRAKCSHGTLCLPAASALEQQPDCACICSNHDTSASKLRKTPRFGTGTCQALSWRCCVTACKRNHAPLCLCREKRPGCMHGEASVSDPMSNAPTQDPAQTKSNYTCMLIKACIKQCPMGPELHAPV